MKEQVIQKFNLTPEQVPLFESYIDLLLKWNAVHNLTSVTDRDQVWVRHIGDSLMLLPFIPKGSSVVDLGTGAGPPGIPLKVVRPDVRMVLVESRGKRVQFCNEAIRTLALENIFVVQGRAELGAGDEGLLDVVISRATWSLRNFILIGKAYRKRGGVMITMKGPNLQEELAEARPIMRAEKLAIAMQQSYRLPGQPESHLIVLQ